MRRRLLENAEKTIIVYAPTGNVVQSSSCNGWQYNDNGALEGRNFWRAFRGQSGDYAHGKTSFPEEWEIVPNKNSQIQKLTWNFRKYEDGQYDKFLKLYPKLYGFNNGVWTLIYTFSLNPNPNASPITFTINDTKKREKYKIVSDGVSDSSEGNAKYLICAKMEISFLQ